MRKIFYSLAVLLAAGSLSLHAQDNETTPVNLLEGCFDSYANNNYPQNLNASHTGYEWGAYTATGAVATDNWPGGSYGARIQTPEINGKTMNILLTRWDMGNHNLFFTVKVHLDGGYKYNFSCIAGAWNNHEPNNFSDAGLYTEGNHGIRVSINNQPGIENGDMSYVVTPIGNDGNAGADRFTKTMKTITLSYAAQEDGDYYISFVGCHGIFPIANLVLTQGEAIDYEGEFNALKTEVTTFLTDNDIELGGSGEREEDMALDAALNPTAEEGGEIDYKAAYNALSAAFATFKDDLPSYQTLDDLQDEAFPYIDLYPYATDETQVAFSNACVARPKTVAEAETATTTLTNAWRAVVESAAIAEGVEGVETITLPTTFTTSLGHLSGEPATLADGTTVTDYYDGGNGGTATQTVTLSAGSYRYAILARASANATTTLNATATNADAIISNVMDLTHAGNTGNIFGRGWNIDMYDFQITEDDTEVTFTIDATGGWFSFVRPTLVKYSAGIDYEELFNNLKEEVTGFLTDNEIELGGKGEREEDSALDAALNPTAEEGQTIDYETALRDLSSAYDAFKLSLPSYNALETLQNEAKPYTDTYEQATEEKQAAFSQACYANPTTAEAAETATTTLTNAWRAVVLSNSIAEGVQGCVDMTNLITNPKANDGTTGWTNTKVTNNCNFSAGTAALPVIEGITHVFDGNDWNNPWETTFTQDVELTLGTYRLAVTARGSVGLTTYQLIADDNAADLTHIGDGATTGVFATGWNDGYLDFDVTESKAVKIGIKAVAPARSNWAGFTNFRLVQLSDPTAVSEIEAAADVEAVYYTIDGVKVSGKLAKGLYIKVAGGKTSKVLVK